MYYSLSFLHPYIHTSLFVCSSCLSRTQVKTSVQNQTQHTLCVWYCPSLDQLRYHQLWTLLEQQLTPWSHPSGQISLGLSLWTRTYTWNLLYNPDTLWPLANITIPPHTHPLITYTLLLLSILSVIPHSLKRSKSRPRHAHSNRSMTTVSSRPTKSPYLLHYVLHQTLHYIHRIPQSTTQLIVRIMHQPQWLCLPPTRPPPRYPSAQPLAKSRKRPWHYFLTALQTLLIHSTYNSATSPLGGPRVGRGFKGTTRQRLRFRDSEEWQCYHNRSGRTSERTAFRITLQQLIPGAQPRPGVTRIRHRHARLHRKRWHRKNKTRLQKARTHRRRSGLQELQTVPPPVQTYKSRSITYKYSTNSTTPPGRLLGGAVHVPSCHPEEALWEYYVIHAHQKLNPTESTDPPLQSPHATRVRNTTKDQAVQGVC